MFGEEIKVLSIDTTTKVVTVNALSEAYATGEGVYVHKAADEGGISGKFLEENVLMGTADNSVPYAIRAGEIVDVEDAYTSITFTMSGNSAESMQGSGSWYSTRRGDV